MDASKMYEAVLHVQFDYINKRGMLRRHWGPSQPRGYAFGDESMMVALTRVCST